MTVAEERVARLVARGDPNAEAGAELFVSARTVESHLRRIFAELEIRTRVELAVLPAHRGPRPAELQVGTCR